MNLNASGGVAQLSSSITHTSMFTKILLNLVELISLIAIVILIFKIYTMYSFGAKDTFNEYSFSTVLAESKIISVRPIISIFYVFKILTVKLFLESQICNR